jgi:hypothetical protein
MEVYSEVLRYLLKLLGALLLLLGSIALGTKRTVVTVTCVCKGGWLHGSWFCTSFHFFERFLAGSSSSQPPTSQTPDQKRTLLRLRAADGQELGDLTSPNKPDTYSTYSP